VDIVRSAIPRMSELKIPITPANYAVWYAYLSESHKELQHEMDALLRSPEPVTGAAMRRLYERYLDERQENVDVAKTALSQVISALLSHIHQADGHYRDFASELRDIADGLAGESDAGSLNRLIDRAVQATNAALDHGNDLKQRFSALAEEMQEVRGRLERLQDEARSDALTGVYNRLAFNEELEGLPAAMQQDSHAPCLLLIDIDHFKRVNDTFGHLAGDHVLTVVAQEIKAGVRGRDLVARYGGEEFVVLLRDTPRSGCIAVAENLRAGIARSPVRLPPDLGQAGELSLTVSIGGAWYREGEAAEALIDRADRSLYRSKEAGRDRVSWE
jgi:diguanylate cyclase